MVWDTSAFCGDVPYLLVSIQYHNFFPLSIIRTIIIKKNFNTPDLNAGKGAVESGVMCAGGYGRYTVVHTFRDVSVGVNCFIIFIVRLGDALCREFCHF